MRRMILAAAAALALTGSANAGGPGSAKEPEGLWMGVPHGYTPSTLKGAKVVDVDAVAALVDKGGVLLIDVGEPDRKPAGLPASAVWRPLHRSLPGAVWFPGAAFGDLKGKEDLLRKRVSALSGGDPDKPIVAFCHPDCWGSWNMGKRLVEWGYTNVNWFPRGVEGWQESDRETSVVKADPEWLADDKPAAVR